MVCGIVGWSSAVVSVKAVGLCWCAVLWLWVICCGFCYGGGV